jgi:ribosome biogenesis GTPase
MSERRRKRSREQDVTARYLSGDFDEDRVEQGERFSERSKHATQRKLERTVAMRAVGEAFEGDLNALPVGEVVQVYSLYQEVQSAGVTYLAVVRKTLAKTIEAGIVVGDRVRIRTTGSTDEQGRPEAVIEALLPRATVLARAESFKGRQMHAIVANADQMLIVASLVNPVVKWGLVDRMIVAAESGKLKPIVCLHKMDLADGGVEARAEASIADNVLAHYASMGITTLRTSSEAHSGIERLAELLRGRSTVLAGHSGVGKSSLIRSIQPDLEIRIGEVSEYTAKGRHTTTSARRYALAMGGAVIDTPGVKVFGLWGVTRENAIDFFPDVAASSAPSWRMSSYQRILASLPPAS